MRLFLPSLLLGLVPGLLAAQVAGDSAWSPNPRPGAGAGAVARAPNITVMRASGPIKIDAKLDDAGWAGAEAIPVDNEVAPGDNVPARVRTVCRVTFDRANLYLGCRALDPAPEQIRAHVVDRDNVSRLAQDDLIGIYIDPFNDQRRAFVFIANPAGAQADAIRTVSTAHGEDFSWDAIWTSRGRVTPEGFEVEMAIPFKSLRFPRTASVQTWGFMFFRSMPRGMRYRISSNRMDRGNTCDLCQAGKVTGFEGIDPGRNLQITPTLTGGRTDVRSSLPAGSLEKGKLNRDLGVDLHLGVTPNVSLNATINPDFSQVEADVAQLEVNRRFALSYPEKRPFFLEGNDLFGTPIQAVFTRTISDPDGGLKLSGKVGGSTRSAVGLFAARDRVTLLQFPSNQFTTGTGLEQEAWTTVGRFRRDLGNASNVGLLYTGRTGTSYLNQVGGVDFFQRLGQSTRITGQFLASVTEYPDSVARLFAQPRGSFAGGAARVELRHDTGRWHAATSYLDLGPDFRADVGFVPRVDVRTVTAEVAPVSYKARGPYAWISAGPFLSRTEDHRGVLTDQDVGLSLAFEGAFQSFGNFQLIDRRERFQGVLYHLRRATGYLDLKPRSGLQLTIQWELGGGIDYANARKATETTLVPAVQLSLGRGLTMDLSNAYQRLTNSGRRILSANILQSKLAYNFSVRTMVRAIVQYREVRRNPLEFAGPIDPKVGDILGQFLFSHKVNPQTVLFLGYSDTGLTTQSYHLTRLSRTFFVKIGYAWRP